MCNCPINLTEKIDIIEKEVYKLLKPYGFRKFGRTLHRFVSGDISQVINFQSGMPANINYGSFCVNLGIRIPECNERCFNLSDETKKYYPEYKCTLRSRLGIIKGEKEIWYDLSDNTDLITAAVINEIENLVIPHIQYT